MLVSEYGQNALKPLDLGVPVPARYGVGGAIVVGGRFLSVTGPAVAGAAPVTATVSHLARIAVADGTPFVYQGEELGLPEHSAITTCAYCGVGCSLLVNTKDGRVISGMDGVDTIERGEPPASPTSEPTSALLRDGLERGLPKTPGEQDRTLREERELLVAITNYRSAFAGRDPQTPPSWWDGRNYRITFPDGEVRTVAPPPEPSM